jgi:hypothetical protein
MSNCKFGLFKVVGDGLDIMSAHETHNEASKALLPLAYDQVEPWEANRYVILKSTTASFVPGRELRIPRSLLRDQDFPIKSRGLSAAALLAAPTEPRLGRDPLYGLRTDPADIKSSTMCSARVTYSGIKFQISRHCAGAENYTNAEMLQVLLDWVAQQIAEGRPLEDHAVTPFIILVGK